MTAALTRRGITGTAQITRDILSYHASPEMVAREAQAAGVRYLVFSHIIPQVPSRTMYPAFLGDARSLYDGPIIVGEDGMMFSLPAPDRARSSSHGGRWAEPQRRVIPCCSSRHLSWSKRSWPKNGSPPNTINGTP